MKCRRKKKTKVTSIRVDVPDKEVEWIDELGKKERWSRRKVVLVGLEYYLKLRGYKYPEDSSG